MKILLLLLSLTLCSFAGDRVTFSNKRYSFEFPQGWTKAKAPNPKADFARESPDKGAVLAVSTSAIPEGKSADLDAIAKSSAESTAKALKFKEEGTISEGMLDGCATRFVTLIPKTVGKEGGIGVFTIFINTKTDLITIQATMALPMDETTRKACLGIVQSFKREDPVEK